MGSEMEMQREGLGKVRDIVWGVLHLSLLV